MSTQRKTKFGRLRRLVHGARAAIFDAALAEDARAEKMAVLEDEKDLFDRLPEPLSHLDIGDVQYFDGKFRYF